jgi:predicted MFS family arabinose efflux permease
MANISATVRGLSFVLLFQMAVVASAQALPVIAPFAVMDFRLPAEYVGYFSAIVYGSALLASNGTSGLMARYGSFTTAAAALGCAGVGALIVSLSTTVVGLVVGAVVMGMAYGPVNPVGSRLLARVSEGRRQNLIFSIKQTSVAIGGASAGLLLPAIAVAFGWRASVAFMALFCALVALLSIGSRRRLGDDANRLASIRFKGPIAPVRLMLADPLLRCLGISVLAFSMAQFGLMSIYVTLLWTQMNMAPELAAAMLAVVLGASIPGRIFWGWRADGVSPRGILGGLAAVGVFVLATFLFMTPAWSTLAAFSLSAALGLGPLSWSGVLMSEIANAGAARGGSEAILSTTAATMVFAYTGGIAGPALLSLSAGMIGSYVPGLVMIAAWLGVAAILLFASTREEPKS